ncbi:radical SAM protein [Fusibacter sp. 3D3]|uniref:radical SAM protein n=1 Tax=Fusibacter sp. 3D3 TaxID=1048380 RepID=UPI000852D3EC|nr:radical SAM protein [Fusibacter sp. 3D3]GAU78562.1 pyruvate formate-lyase activating enzyme [Fusibacter sp. 3D3]
MIGYIRNMIKNSAVDGPGNRFVVFLQGCQFNCLYCHNPETIKSITLLTAKEVLEVREYSPKALVDTILPYKDYISGVTFSGGECTLQLPFLMAVCALLKAEGIHILIDTNGHIPLERLKRLCEHVDGFMLDLKALDSKNHKALTGLDNAQVLENFIVLNEAHKLYEIRTVIIPELVDDKALIDWVSAHDGCHLRYKLIAFRNHGVKGEGTKLTPPDTAYMRSIEKYAIQKGFKNIVLI